MGDRDRDRDRWVLPSSRARWKNGSCDTADAHGPVCARPAVVLLIAAGDAGTGTCAAAPRACQRVRGTRVRQHLAGAGRRLGTHCETVVRSDTVHANGLARVRHWWSGGPYLARQPHSCARLTVSAAPASVLQGPGSLRRQRQRSGPGQEEKSQPGKGQAPQPQQGQEARQPEPPATEEGEGEWVCARARAGSATAHVSPEHIPA